MDVGYEKNALLLYAARRDGLKNGEEGQACRSLISELILAAQLGKSAIRKAKIARHPSAVRIE